MSIDRYTSILVSKKLLNHLRLSWCGGAYTALLSSSLQCDRDAPSKYLCIRMQCALYSTEHVLDCTIVEIDVRKPKHVQGDISNFRSLITSHLVSELAGVSRSTHHGKSIRGEECPHQRIHRWCLAFATLGKEQSAVPPRDLATLIYHRYSVPYNCTEGQKDRIIWFRFTVDRRNETLHAARLNKIWTTTTRGRKVY